MNRPRRFYSNIQQYAQAARMHIYSAVVMCKHQIKNYKFILEFLIEFITIIMVYAGGLSRFHMAFKFYVQQRQKELAPKNAVGVFSIETISPAFISRLMICVWHAAAYQTK